MNNFYAVIVTVTDRFSQCSSPPAGAGRACGGAGVQLIFSI